MTDKEHEKRMEEIDKAHWAKLSAEGEVQKPVTFSMKELNLLRHATLHSSRMYYESYGEEDTDMRAVMRKVDKLIEDMEIEIRDGTVLQQGEWIKETPLREVCPFCKAIRTDYRHVYCGVCGAYLGGDRSGTETN